MLELIMNYMVWDPNPSVIPGWERPPWYSILFAAGFVISQQFMVNFLNLCESNLELSKVIFSHVV